MRYTEMKTTRALLAASMVLSLSIIGFLGIRGGYFVLWSAILCVGLTGLTCGIYLALQRGMPRYIWIICFVVVVVAIALAYLFWPFRYDVEIQNSLENPILARITLQDDQNRTVFNGTRGVLNLTLWKGSYHVVVHSVGFVPKEYQVSVPFGIRWNRIVRQVVVLDPKYIDLAAFEFHDPTTYLNLSPSLSVRGRNVLGELVSEVYPSPQLLMYGDYFIHAEDGLFSSDVEFHGDAFLVDGLVSRNVILDPGDQFLILSDNEAGYVQNFLHDYLNFSARNLLDEDDLGFPDQFYLFQRDEVLSPGKMLFLWCEIMTYDAMNVSVRTFFIPRDQVFVEGAAVPSVGDCYRSVLSGAIPRSIGDADITDLVVRDILGSSSFSFVLPDLNHAKRRLDIAFSFDIESGRYVSDIAASGALSPCTDANYSLGLADDELLCSSPAIVAWMSPRASPYLHDEFPYPQVSGLLGFREIVGYSERYGIPTTNYFTKKDLLAFAILDPVLVDRSKALVQNGLMEVGSHTRYHTNLNLVGPELGRREIYESKIFLEEFFNTTVYGFRAPYLSVLGSEDAYARTLWELGFSYYSQSSPYAGRVSWYPIVHKPWSGGSYGGPLSLHDVKEMIKYRSYIITLDHPWNIYYRDGPVLVEDPSLPDHYRAEILTAISNGAIPTTVRELELDPLV